MSNFNDNTVSTIKASRQTAKRGIELQKVGCCWRQDVSSMKLSGRHEEEMVRTIDGGEANYNETGHPASAYNRRLIIRYYITMISSLFILLSLPLSLNSTQFP